MPNVHLTRDGPPPSRWQVRVDGDVAEPFDCPVEALLRAKALYAQLGDKDGAPALLVDFHGHHETQLLPR